MIWLVLLLVGVIILVVEYWLGANWLNPTTFYSVEDALEARNPVKSLIIASPSKLREFPTVISSFSNLTKLVIKNQGIEVIPESIRNLHKLRMLKLSNNNIKALPNSIGQLKNLTKLDLSFNLNLCSLPSALLGLSMLKSLNIRETGIDRLPQPIEKLESLRWIGGLEGLSSNERRNIFVRHPTFKNPRFPNFPG